MGHSVTTLKVNTIEPAGSTLTLGASGDSVVLADDVKSNTYKDAGGNTLFVSNGSGVLSSVNSGFGDSLKLLSTTTISSAVANVSFTSGITSAYKEYIFKCININPASNDIYFQFQCSTDGGSNYNTTVTSTAFTAYISESGGGAVIQYRTSEHNAQATTFQDVSGSVGNASDKSNIVELHLFNPSSTTYVKNWYSKSNAVNGDGTPTFNNEFMAGYFNTTSAINAIQFKFASGNIATGTIKMYGIL